MSTTDVSASRLMIESESVGGVLVPIWFTSCFTSRATVPCSPMRGVTVRTTPASRYSTEIGRATSELQSPCNLVCRLLLEKKKASTGCGAHGAKQTVLSYYSHR